MKTKVYNKMVSAAEAKQFVEVNSAVPYKKKKSRGIKILLAMLAGILGLFLLLFLWVFMAEMPNVH
jgi:hypothetical protein